MPRRITFSRSVSYDLDSIKNDLIVLDEEGRDYTEQELIDYAYTWAQEDMSCGWGHTFTGYLDMEVTDE